MAKSHFIRKGSGDHERFVAESSERRKNVLSYYTVVTEAGHTSHFLSSRGQCSALSMRSHARAGSTDDLERVPQGVGGIYFVVAVGADQHQMAQIRLRQEILEHFEQCHVEPLQIVENLSPAASKTPSSRHYA
jgi:hypothetical protein